MQALIETYSASEFLLFLVTFALAIKGLVSFWDWGYARLKQIFKKETDKEQEIDSIQKQFDDHLKSYEDLQNSQNQSLEYLVEKVKLLIDSDKDNIKSFITERHHHFCYEQGWIDDYSLDCIEKRYSHYVDEGGNSFIHDLMEELRKLQKHPPEEISNK